MKYNLFGIFSHLPFSWLHIRSFHRIRRQVLGSPNQRLRWFDRGALPRRRAVAARCTCKCNLFLPGHPLLPLPNSASSFLHISRIIAIQSLRWAFMIPHLLFMLRNKGNRQTHSAKSRKLINWAFLNLGWNVGKFYGNDLNCSKNLNNVIDGHRWSV